MSGGTVAQFHVREPSRCFVRTNDSRRGFSAAFAIRKLNAFGPGGTLVVWPTVAAGPGGTLVVWPTVAAGPGGTLVVWPTVAVGNGERHI